MHDDAAIAVRKAEAADASLVFQLIRELAEFEKISHEVVATEETIRESLFGGGPPRKPSSRTGGRFRPASPFTSRTSRPSSGAPEST